MCFLFYIPIIYKGCQVPPSLLTAGDAETLQEFIGWDEN